MSLKTGNLLMNRETELRSMIKTLEDQLKPLQKELNELWNKKADDVEERISLAEQGHGNFQLDELRFAAFVRCECGAGLCYPKESSPRGAWYCSDILRGLAVTGKESKLHSGAMPFSFYSIKSEDQPSANGETTRPVE